MQNLLFAHVHPCSPHPLYRRLIAFYQIFQRSPSSVKCLGTLGSDGDLNCRQEKSGEVPLQGKASGWLGRNSAELVKPLFSFARTGLKGRQIWEAQERRKLKSLVLQELPVTTEAAG